MTRRTCLIGKTAQLLIYSLLCATHGCASLTPTSVPTYQPEVRQEESACRTLEAKLRAAALSGASLELVDAIRALPLISQSSSNLYKKVSELAIHGDYDGVEEACADNQQRFCQSMSLSLLRDSLPHVPHSRPDNRQICQGHNCASTVLSQLTNDSMRELLVDPPHEVIRWVASRPIDCNAFGVSSSMIRAASARHPEDSLLTYYLAQKEVQCGLVATARYRLHSATYLKSSLLRAWLVPRLLVQCRDPRWYEVLPKLSECHSYEAFSECLSVFGLLMQVRGVPVDSAAQALSKMVGITPSVSALAARYGVAESLVESIEAHIPEGYKNPNDLCDLLDGAIRCGFASDAIMRADSRCRERQAALKRSVEKYATQIHLSGSGVALQDARQSDGINVNNPGQRELRQTLLAGFVGRDECLIEALRAQLTLVGVYVDRSDIRSRVRLQKGGALPPQVREYVKARSDVRWEEFILNREMALKLSRSGIPIVVMYPYLFEGEFKNHASVIIDINPSTLECVMWEPAWIHVPSCNRSVMEFEGQRAFVCIPVAGEGFDASNQCGDAIAPVCTDIDAVLLSRRYQDLKTLVGRLPVDERWRAAPVQSIASMAIGDVDAALSWARVSIKSGLRTGMAEVYSHAAIQLGAECEGALELESYSAEQPEWITCRQVLVTLYTLCGRVGNALDIALQDERSARGTQRAYLWSSLAQWERACRELEVDSQSSADSIAALDLAKIYALNGQWIVSRAWLDEVLLRRSDLPRALAAVRLYGVWIVRHTVLSAVSAP